MRRANLKSPARSIHYAGNYVRMDRIDTALHLHYHARKAIIRDGNVGAFPYSFREGMDMFRSTPWKKISWKRKSEGRPWRPYWWLWSKKKTSAGRVSPKKRNRRSAYKSAKPAYTFYKASTRKKLSQYSRRCTCKISYTNRVRGAGYDRSTVKCIEYIARKEATLAEGKPGWDKAREGSVLYTYDRKGCRSYVNMKRAVKLLGEKGLFRIILSPEDPGADLNELARRFIKESFAPAVGCSGLKWVAANHFNTEHPHVHILVSRTPARGAKAKFTDDDNLICFHHQYITRGKAENGASKILTEMCGPRNVRENMEAVRKELSLMERSPVDRLIGENLEKCQGGWLLSYDTLDGNPDREQVRLMKQRANFLMMHSDAVSPAERQGWFFTEHWQRLFEKEEIARRLDTDGRDAGEIEFDDMKDERGGKREEIPEGEIIDYRIDEKDPFLVFFSIRDRDGKIHIRKERLDEDEGKNASEDSDEGRNYSMSALKGRLSRRKER